MLEVENINVFYGDAQALWDVLEVKNINVYAILVGSVQLADFGF
jgi:ABC-type arginine transport system ATPase subunit